jgi:hypothetical protein
LGRFPSVVRMRIAVLYIAMIVRDVVLAGGASL